MTWSIMATLPCDGGISLSPAADPPLASAAGRPLPTGPARVYPLWAGWHLLQVNSGLKRTGGAGWLRGRNGLRRWRRPGRCRQHVGGAVAPGPAAGPAPEGGRQPRDARQNGPAGVAPAAPPGPAGPG